MSAPITPQRYDGTLQMFCENEPREVDMPRLQFLRWLGEHDQLEHACAGPSSGPLFDTALEPVLGPDKPDMTSAQRVVGSD